MSPEEFKAIRIKLGFKSPTAFSVALGLSHKVIYNYECGSSIIKKPMSMLMRVMDKATVPELIEMGLYKNEG